MTQFTSMRTTDPPSAAPKRAAGGRLRQSQGVRLKATGAASDGREIYPVGEKNLIAMTVLAGLPEHLAVTRSVKSP